MPKDEEIVPVFTSLISFSHLFKSSLDSSSSTRSYFYFTPAVISQEPNRLKAKPLNQTDSTQKVKRRISPNAALERTSCQTSPIYLPGETLIYPGEQKRHEHVEHNTAFHRGRSVTMQEQPQGISRGSQPKPSKGARNCFWVYPRVHVQHPWHHTSSKGEGGKRLNRLVITGSSSRPRRKEQKCYLAWCFHQQKEAFGVTSCVSFREGTV